MDDWQDLKPIGPSNPRVTPFVRPPGVSITPPSIRETGTLRPEAEWFPAWMRYRQRDDNYVFWQDKFVRCSLEIPEHEKRWTLFSTVWWLVTEIRFMGVPPALRFLLWLGWRAALMRAYELHKVVVLWQCKLDATLAARAVRMAAAAAAADDTAGDSDWTPAASGSVAAAAPSNSSSSGSGMATATTVQFRTAPAAVAPAAASAAAFDSPAAGSSATGGSGPLGVTATSSASPSGSSDERGHGAAAAAAAAAPGPGFSRAMALRRLHWRNSLLAEILYCINVIRTGRVHFLPPEKRPLQRPTFFWLF